MISYEVSYKSSNECDTALRLLIDDKILSEDFKVLDMNRFLDFGLFSFLSYKLYQQKVYYHKKLTSNDNQCDNKIDLESLSLNPYIDYKMVNIGNNIGLFIYSSNDQFLSFHLDFPKNFLDKLPNGDRNHDVCILNSTFNYNYLYLKNKGKTCDNFPSCDDYDSCKNHKTDIIKYCTDNPDNISIFGGWGFLFNVDYHFSSFFTDLSDSNTDLFFNIFLSIYFGNVLSIKSFHSEFEFSKPFKSHEIDVCLIKNNSAIILEPNTKFTGIISDFKNKIYNCFTLKQVFDEIFLYYLTFDEKSTDNSLDSFLQHNINDINSNIYISKNIFPNFFRDIKNLENIKKDDILKDFKLFLNDIENDINEKLSD